ncbi:MAG: 4-hydroxy-tetrahydrodipicolinate reductase [Oscillospiraceae bacterium]|nr:4-hydroxy-tetrahydrodipicolinate reductase [Oscillospiraceae bacterium]
MKIMLTGYNGRMGRAIIEAAANKQEEFDIVAGVDINPAAINFNFPVFLKPSDYKDKADIIIDFSWHDSIDSLLEYADSSKTPVVIATTGHTDEEMNLIKSYADKIAMFKSANMSLGVNLLAELAKKAAILLKDDFDIEIIEKHHNQKLDAPSGTAMMIAGEISSVFADSEKPEYIYDRHNVRRARGEKELGIHSVRGGTIIGEHEVIFAGVNELITISHSAQSREMFANGALAAAKFLICKSPGLYTMKDLINEITEK